MRNNVDLRDLDVDRLLFFALLRLYPTKTEEEITWMLDKARKALETL